MSSLSASWLSGPQKSQHTSISTPARETVAEMAGGVAKWCEQFEDMNHCEEHLAPKGGNSQLSSHISEEQFANAWLLRTLTGNQLYTSLTNIQQQLHGYSQEGKDYEYHSGELLQVGLLKMYPLLSTPSSLSPSAMQYMNFEYWLNDCHMLLTAIVCLFDFYTSSQPVHTGTQGGITIY